MDDTTNLQKIHKIIDEHQKEYYPEYYPEYACKDDEDYYNYLLEEDYVYEKKSYSGEGFDETMRVSKLGDKYVAYFVGVTTGYRTAIECGYKPDYTNIYEVFPKKVKTVVYE